MKQLIMREENQEHEDFYRLYRIKLSIVAVFGQDFGSFKF